MTKRAALILIPCFLIAIALTFLFAYRVGRNARNIRWAQEPIRPWMSVPFIAHVHHVPEQDLFRAINVTPRQPPDRRPLRRIAREEKRPVDDLIRELNQVIAAERGSVPGKGKAP